MRVLRFYVAEQEDGLDETLVVEVENVVAGEAGGTGRIDELPLGERVRAQPTIVFVRNDPPGLCRRKPWRCSTLSDFANTIFSERVSPSIFRRSASGIADQAAK
jgi:hypothetical protein